MTKDLLSLIVFGWAGRWAGRVEGCQRQEEDAIFVLKCFVL